MLKNRDRPKQIILINRDLQFRYVRLALVIGLVATVLSTVVILYPLYQFEILRIPQFLPLPIMIGMVTALVINMIGVMLLTVVISHRIAGPIFALSREFSEVGQGVFGRQLRSRKYDDLQYLVRSFNDMSICLKNLMYDDLEIVSQNREVLEMLKVKVAALATQEQQQEQQRAEVMDGLTAMQVQLRAHHDQLKARVGEKPNTVVESSAS